MNRDMLRGQLLFFLLLLVWETVIVCGTVRSSLDGQTSVFGSASGANQKQPARKQRVAAQSEWNPYGIAPVASSHHNGAAASSHPVKAAHSNDVGHKLSQAEISEFEEDFHHFDMNSDGLLDAQEIRAAFGEIGNLRPYELYQFFYDVDKDDSGTVTKPEYIAYALTMEYSLG
eukprot:GHVU01123538.1.p2 GENE.GHVU01123538.1~~GHVU01123538.1.p2  ORF type:complete len:173 (-),score=26.94 GHVU01123538.1:1219-1737(-)